MTSHDEFGVILFHTTSMALRSEKALKKAGLTVKLVPIPRDLSSDCGLALRFIWSQVATVRTTLAALKVEWAEVRQMP